MDFKNLLNDEKAVSPVIGVILMVAITVILAAVIGTFVLGLGDQVQSTTPQAQFGFDVEQNHADGTKVVITHESGDTISGSDLKVSATTTFSHNGSVSGADGWNGGGESEYTWETIDGQDASAGAGVAIGNNGDLTGETIRVIYDSPDSDSSSTLAKKEL